MFFFVVFCIALVGCNGASIPEETFTREDLDLLMVQTFGDSDNFTVECLIDSQGYPVETHHVTTSDGYILALHRIPHGRTSRNKGKVAFLQHGLLASSADWCILGAGKALAFQLADEGYDVWLGNARGNSWSRNHTTLKPSDIEFWDFSWHEIGIIDIPTMIDYVLETTGQSAVYYVGHSQGTTAYYVMLSRLPEYNKKIAAAASLAPIAFMNHMTSPLLHILSFWTGTMDFLFNIIGMYEFLPNDNFMKRVMSDTVCACDTISQLLCTNSLFAICGFSRSQMNTTLLPYLMKFTPAGSSTHQLLHYGQEIKSGRFRQYDFGLLSNTIIYGRLTPPGYDLSKVTAATYLIYSKNDWLSSEKDVLRLCDAMKVGCKGKILMSDFEFNHLDYMFGIDAPKLVYNKVISLFARH
ncbi:unnamed protein product [Ceutorhynchus assimilis]|uniref:Lipase n=1 Tax=Ceutorhynchus assimilis TaxID=467358 RepID=A0A9N9MPS3_9CUCU|nr:unnamed protein product [Ceutorhynchus assimilis]